MLKTGTIFVALLSVPAAAADVRPMPADGRFWEVRRGCYANQ